MSVSLDENNSFLPSIGISDSFDSEESSICSTEKKSSTLVSKALAKIQKIFSKKAKKIVTTKLDNAAAINLQNKVNNAWITHLPSHKQSTYSTTFMERYDSQQTKDSLTEYLDIKFNPLFVENDDNSSEEAVMEFTDFLGNKIRIPHEMCHVTQQ